MFETLLTWFLFPGLRTYTTLPHVQYHAGVACLYARSNHNPNHVLVYFHGNGQDLGTSWRQINDMSEALQMTVVAMEYRGYGCMSLRHCTIDGVVVDARRVLRHLKSVYKHVHVCGYSIGAAVAAAAAQHETCAQLVLVAPFYNLQKMVHDTTGLGSLLHTQVFDTASTLASMQSRNIPLSIVHGAKDALISVDHAHALKYNVPLIDLHVQEDRGHNNIQWTAVHKVLKKNTRL